MLEFFIWFEIKVYVLVCMKNVDIKVACIFVLVNIRLFYSDGRDLYLFVIVIVVYLGDFGSSYYEFWILLIIL